MKRCRDMLDAASAFDTLEGLGFRMSGLGVRDRVLAVIRLPHAEPSCGAESL